MDPWNLFIQAVADFAAGEKCRLCGDPLLESRAGRYPVCRRCEAGLVPINGARCSICSMPLISEIDTCLCCRERRYPFGANHSLFVYRDEIKELIYQYKTRSQKSLSWFFAERSAKYIHRYFPGVWVVPVPFRRIRKTQQGWDQIQLITVLLRKYWNIPVLNILRRRKSGPQKLLGYEERKLNIKGKIKLRYSAKDLPEKILLLDDVFTTGATGSECAKVLLNAGVSEVDMLTLAID